MKYNRLLEYLLRKKRYEFELHPPYSVDLVDMFEGQSEDGYGNMEKNLGRKEAIETANHLTEEALSEVKGKVDKWLGMGDAGLVYDSQGNLVWDGVIEFGHTEELQILMKDKDSGFKRITDAIDFAVIAHQGQFRKGTNTPYIVHPIAVAQELLRFECSPEVLVTGILHDTLEDTTVKLSDILRQFGSKVADILIAVSEQDKRKTWENRKLDTINKLKDAPLDVLWVECADKLDNIYALEVITNP